MNFRMPRRVKDLLILYVHQYAQRILDSRHDTAIINSFDPKAAATAATKALLRSDKITQNEKDKVLTEEGQKSIVNFFDEKLIVNYFMLSRKIEYHEAKSLITDKGVDFFEETKGIKTTRYTGRFHDYKATDKQKEYIRSFGSEIKHEDELSGREASLIISCLKTPNKTKPAYFTYYIEKEA